MNPIEHFEKSARKIWAAELEPEDKARRMMKLAEAVDHYVQRLDEKSTNLVTPGDHWAQCTLARARAHLAAIATDAKMMGKKLQTKQTAKAS